MGRKVGLKCINNKENGESMGILEIELTLGLSTAVDVYAMEYERRYKVKPIGGNEQADRLILKDLIRKTGLDHTCDLIKLYLKMNEPWFLTKAHSLKVLRENLDLVNSKLATTTPVRKVAKGMQVIIWVKCDLCSVSFTTVCEAGFAYSKHDDVYCERCQTIKDKALKGEAL